MILLDGTESENNAEIILLQSCLHVFFRLWRFVGMVMSQILLRQQTLHSGVFENDEKCVFLYNFNVEPYGQ